MAYTTIDDPSAHFQTALYTGNGSSQSITNDGNSDLQPDWIWGSLRNEDGGARFVFDSSRGTTKRLKTNANTEEQVRSGVTAFNSDGFTVGSHSDSNLNTKSLVAWQWKANGGSTTTNDASATSVGDIDSVYQANTTAGFSIVTYTHTGNDDRVAHGLGATPQIVIVKERGGAGSWYFMTTQVDGSLDYLLLESTNANGQLSYSTFTSTTFPSLQFDNTDTAVAYCFTPIQGYSKFGRYTGNGSADGPFVYTGFKPAWVMIKNTSATANWHMYDNKRDATNVVETAIQANTSAVEFTTSNKMDFLSNGFKNRAGDQVSTNTSGSTYIYMAFAEHPFVSSEGVPVTAR